MDKLMDNVIAVGLTLVVLLAIAGTVEALSIDTQKNIEIILQK